MKQRVMGILLVVSSCFMNIAHAQEQEIQQLLLDVEKLAQLKNILTDLKKGYAIVSGGYETIKKISEGNFDLHQQFLQGLLNVNPVVRNHSHVADIIQAQIAIVREYKHAFRLFKTCGQFKPEEVAYMTAVYAQLFDKSLKNLDALAMVVTANKLRMSDAERLDAIDGIWAEAQNEQTFLRSFNNQAKMLALQRAHEAADLGVAKTIYGISR